MVTFCGKTVVFKGNRRQSLPVVRRASRAAIIASTLKKSYLCRNFETLCLTTNIRFESIDVNAHQEARAFSNWSLDVGEGKLENLLSVLRHMLLQRILSNQYYIMFL